MRTLYTLTDTALLAAQRYVRAEFRSAKRRTVLAYGTTPQIGGVGIGCRRGFARFLRALTISSR